MMHDDQLLVKEDARVVDASWGCFQSCRLQTSLAFKAHNDLIPFAVARKSDIVRERALQAVVRLFLDLPAQGFLSSSEAQCLLVFAGASDALDKDRVTAASSSKNATCLSARLGTSKSLHIRERDIPVVV